MEQAVQSAVLLRNAVPDGPGVPRGGAGARAIRAAVCSRQRGAETDQGLSRPTAQVCVQSQCSPQTL